MIRVLVLGGCGSQGRAALYDLSKNERVAQIVCADRQPELLDTFDFIDRDRVRSVCLDAGDPKALAAVMQEDVDVVLDFLPPACVRAVAEAAIEKGVDLVNTNYAVDLADLDSAARQKGVAIMPECGLDPGIDLVLYNYSLGFFDQITRLNSYCGGIPATSACDNPLNYKISWNIDAVLASQHREAMLIADFKPVRIPADQQHDNPFVHQIDFPGLGRLEAIPNGNAARYAALLNMGDQLRETGRYSLRWPGWCAFWAPVKKLGFLSREPVKGLDCRASPFEMTAKILGDRLQYGDGEKDLAVMVNLIEGVKNGRSRKMTCSLLIERDLSTGLMAMSMGVAYPACIVAGMMVDGRIAKKGVLSPAVDVPCDPFFDALKKRGIQFSETIEPAD